MSQSSPPVAGLPPSLSAAVARLEKALDVLESAAARRLEEEMSLADLEEELAVMQDDRSRLAQDLDAALARAASIEKTRDEVLRRLERASASVASVLGLSPTRDGDA
jgi:chromosome segregation ATPase